MLSKKSIQIIYIWLFYENISYPLIILSFYNLEYYPYDTTLMQGATIMSHHQQPLPPPHHQLHNLQQSNLIASIPSAHVIAPLHQIHPQQVIIRKIVLSDNSLTNNVRKIKLKLVM